MPAPEAAPIVRLNASALLPLPAAVLGTGMNPTAGTANTQSATPLPLTAALAPLPVTWAAPITVPVDATPVAAAPVASAVATTATAATTVTAPQPPIRLARADYFRCSPPAHPPALRERGIEGAVTLRVRVDAQGRAAEVQLLAGSGWRLFDEAALHQVRGCRFIPAMRGDQAIDSWVEFPVRFVLSG